MTTTVWQLKEDILGRHGSDSLCRVERKNKMAATYNVLGRHGSDSLCRVERKNKMAATYNVLAFKR